MKHRTDYWEQLENEYSNMGKVKRNEETTNTDNIESKVIKSKDKYIESQEKIHLVLFASMWFLSYFV